mmetsp:Transcript_145964/g.467990  ORF Transcript_145964/g.467990 Transcript_145964/m.467990 type:complete len:246 (+) Transcript_145964:2236-2973(+)
MGAQVRIQKPNQETTDLERLQDFSQILIVPVLDDWRIREVHCNAAQVRNQWLEWFPGGLVLQLRTELAEHRHGSCSYGHCRIGEEQLQSLYGLLAVPHEELPNRAHHLLQGPKRVASQALGRGGVGGERQKGREELGPSLRLATFGPLVVTQQLVRQALDTVCNLPAHSTLSLRAQLLQQTSPQVPLRQKFHAMSVLNRGTPKLRPSRLRLGCARQALPQQHSCLLAHKNLQCRLRESPEERRDG